MEEILDIYTKDGKYLGTKTREEYRKWLLYMQSQKRIKEAFE